MCEYKFKKGKNSGNNCQKKNMIGSLFCSSHDKNPTIPNPTIPNPTISEELSPIPSQSSIDDDNNMITIRFSKELLSHIDNDNLSDVYMDKLIELLNTIKMQSLFMKSKTFIDI